MSKPVKSLLDQNEDNSVRRVFVDFKQTLTSLSFVLKLSALFQKI